MSEVLPPAPPPRAGGDPWKWAAITCGGLGCLVVVGLIALFVIVLNSPQTRQFLTAIGNADRVARDMGIVGKAIDQYAKDKKRYPAKLTDLIPNYLPDTQSLRSSVDPNGPPFLYTPPPKNAPSDTVLLQYNLPPPLPGAAPGTIKLLKDGRITGVEEYKANLTGGRLPNAY